MSVATTVSPRMPSLAMSLCARCGMTRPLRACGSRMNSPPHAIVVLRWLAWEDANHAFIGETSKLGALSLQVSSCDKLVVQGHWALALADYGAVRLETCVKRARHALAMRPRLAGHYIILAACLAELGELPGADDTLVAAWAMCAALVDSRLAGICYFVLSGLTDCYVRALRLADRGERPSAGAPGLHSGSRRSRTMPRSDPWPIQPGASGRSRAWWPAGRAMQRSPRGWASTTTWPNAISPMCWPGWACRREGLRRPWRRGTG